MDPRTAATVIVTDVLAKGRSLSTALDQHLCVVESAGDKALAQELSYGVLRWQPRLALLLSRLLKRPLRRKDRDLEVVLLLGLYQLGYLRTPPHAAVAETVSVTRHVGKAWAGALVNGVLRNYLRRRDELDRETLRAPAAHWAHPLWLIDAVSRSWPDHWQAVLTANNDRPPLALRVNALSGGREAYIRRLQAHGIEARPIPNTGHGIVLARPVDPVTLPGFDDGACSVQDGAAQLAASLLSPRPGERVLDACCAPGGKTAHLLELQPAARVVAVDKDPQRVQAVRANLARLKLEAQTVAADAADPRRWWDGRPFDRILLDAPCSATGVIRRHPDIKTLRRPTDVAALADIQRRLLEALWPLLKPGGMLLYTTCSVLREENQERIAAFAGDRPDVRVDGIDAPWGHRAEPGRQVLPGEDGMDGFYYARLLKQPH